jgi:aspartyl-tRNA synthetase
MIAGFDRYVQICRCFRDEDLRADRQPEFTQIDVEMSFASEALVQGVVEGAIKAMFGAAGFAVSAPFPRLSYDEAMAVYGSDKPDLRPGMLIRDLSALFADSAFSVFRDAVASGGVVRGFVATGGAGYSRKDLDGLTEQARQQGASGIVWVRLAQGALQSSALKAAGEAPLRAAFEAAGGADGDLLLIAAGDAPVVARALGHLRLVVAKRENLLSPTDFRFAWVTEFPLFEWNGDEKRWDSMHHPFTSPRPEDMPLLGTDPGKVRARAYDLALNGSEIAGGGIRIHRADVQRHVQSARHLRRGCQGALWFSSSTPQVGPPPHGGIAFGMDRLAAMLAGHESIREVMAFPKTAQASDLMAGAPSAVDARQLRELRIKLDGV